MFSHFATANLKYFQSAYFMGYFERLNTDQYNVFHIAQKHKNILVY